MAYPLTPRARSKPLCLRDTLPPDLHAGTMSAYTPSPGGSSTVEARWSPLPSFYNASVPPCHPTHPHRVRSMASYLLACTFGSFCLLGSCRLTHKKSRATSCKVRKWEDESSFRGEETSRKLTMRTTCPMLVGDGQARPDPLSPVLVIKVMTVLLMPSLSRE